MLLKLSALRVDFTAIGIDNAHSGTDFVVIDNKNCNENAADIIEKTQKYLHISKNSSNFAGKFGVVCPNGN